MEIEYNFTLQDDIDNWLIFNAWSSNQSWFKWVLRGLTIFCIMLGFYFLIIGITNQTNLNPAFIIFTGVMSIIGGILFNIISNPKYLLKFGYDKEIKKNWMKKSREEEPRKIIINSEELTFITEFTELSWTWKAFKDYFEGEKGFLLWFYDLDTPYYIAKRAFSNLDEIKEFKNIFLQHNK